MVRMDKVAELFGTHVTVHVLAHAALLLQRLATATNYHTSSLPGPLLSQQQLTLQAFIRRAHRDGLSNRQRCRAA